MDEFKREQWVEAMRAVLGPKWAVSERELLYAVRGWECLTYNDDDLLLEYSHASPTVRDNFKLSRKVYGGDFISDAIAKIVVAGRMTAQFFMAKDDVGLLGYRRPDDEGAAK